MRWVISQAKGPNCPRDELLLELDRRSSESHVAYHGVGMGDAGIVLALDAFADRTGDPTFRALRACGRRWACEQLTGERRSPASAWIRRRRLYETGYLSGSAGAAYMFLSRYEHDRRSRAISRPHAGCCAG